MTVVICDLKGSFRYGAVKIIIIQKPAAASCKRVNEWQLHSTKVIRLCYVYSMFPAATAITFQVTVDKTGWT